MKFSIADLADVPQSELEAEYISPRKVQAQEERKAKKEAKAGLNMPASYDMHSLVAEMSGTVKENLEVSIGKDTARFMFGEVQACKIASMAFSRRAKELEARIHIEPEKAVELTKQVQLYSLMSHLADKLSLELMDVAVDTLTNKLEDIYKRYNKK